MESGFIQTCRESAEAIRAELNAGLLAEQACTSPKYLYDALGSKLFEAICELPEYYPTRTEAAIFEAHLDAIADSIGRGSTLIDLGAGNCAKAARLFPALLPAQYVPIDISVEHLREAVGHLQQRFPQVDMLGLGMDFSNALALPDLVRHKKRLFFYPGSSIGNFTPDEALVFFRRLREACGSDGGILIGVDLLKDKASLDAAYDDALGVTAAFNRNVLSVVNRELGADFEESWFEHVALWNAEREWIEMHLLSLRDQVVTVEDLDLQVRFARGELMRTEISAKFRPEGVQRELAEAGMELVHFWTDPAGDFALSLARVSRPAG